MDNTVNGQSSDFLIDRNNHVEDKNLCVTSVEFSTDPSNESNETMPNENISDVSAKTSNEKWCMEFTKEMIDNIDSVSSQKAPSDPTSYQSTIESIYTAHINVEADDDDGWNETESNGLEPTMCLFCNTMHETIKSAMLHCLSEHHFNLYELKKRHNMDIYSYIKMVNYIRQCNPTPFDIMSTKEQLWADDKYLKPVVQDQWLMFDFEEWESNIKKKLMELSSHLNSSNKAAGSSKTSVSELEFKAKLLEKALQDIEKMRQVTKSLVEKSDGTSGKLELETFNLDYGYFNTYAHFGIHHEMLSDTVRTTSYQSAILDNKEMIKNKIVLDLGCGTSILSMFCASADAEQVYGIDQSEIIYNAMAIVKENNFENKIKLIHGRIENSTLPVEKVDIIVSEWMGYFLLFEGMLTSLILARDKYLKPDGKLLPDRCTLHIVGCSDLDRHNHLIGFWKDVYGFKMSCMTNEVIREANIEIVPADKIITTTALLLDLNLYTCKSDDANFNIDFTLTALEDGFLTSLVGYFDTFFNLNKTVSFSTGPQATPTHWKQTVFYLSKPLEVKKNGILGGSLKCEKAKGDPRGLVVTIAIADIIEEYQVN